VQDQQERDVPFKRGRGEEREEFEESTEWHSEEAIA
jgi:hypothetical protein